MDNTTAIASIEGLIKGNIATAEGYTAQNDALNVALAVLQTGFQSDTAAIQAAKDETAAVQAKLDALKASIAGLTA